MLKAAGAKEPSSTPLEDGAAFAEQMIAAGRSVKKAAPMFSVPDTRSTAAWYESVGFRVEDRYEEGDQLLFARVTFGGGEFTLGPGAAGPRGVSLWFFTDRVHELYRLLKERHVRASQTILSGGASGDTSVQFDEDLYQPFYGGHQFSIRDVNGLSLIFWQPAWLSTESPLTPDP